MLLVPQPGAGLRATARRLRVPPTGGGLPGSSRQQIRDSEHCGLCLAHASTALGVSSRGLELTLVPRGCCRPLEANGGCGRPLDAVLGREGQGEAVFKTSQP